MAPSVVDRVEGGHGLAGSGRAKLRLPRQAYWPWPIGIGFKVIVASFGRGLEIAFRGEVRARQRAHPGDDLDALSLYPGTYLQLWNIRFLSRSGL